MNPGATGTCLYKSCSLGFPKCHCDSCLGTALADSLFYPLWRCGVGVGQVGSMGTERGICRKGMEPAFLRWCFDSGASSKAYFPPENPLAWQENLSFEYSRGCLQALSKETCPGSSLATLCQWKLWQLQGEQRGCSVRRQPEKGTGLRCQILIPYNLHAAKGHG